MSRITPSVTVQLDKERHLRYDLNALVDIEEATGKDFSVILNAKRLSFKEIRAVLWGGLRREDPSLTLEQVGAMLDGRNLMYARGRMIEAINASMPDPTTGEPKNEESPSDGASSGPTDAAT